MYTVVRDITVQSLYQASRDAPDVRATRLATSERPCGRRVPSGTVKKKGILSARKRGQICLACCEKSASAVPNGTTEDAVKCRTGSLRIGRPNCRKAACKQVGRLGTPRGSCGDQPRPPASPLRIRVSGPTGSRTRRGLSIRDRGGWSRNRFDPQQQGVRGWQNPPQTTPESTGITTVVAERAARNRRSFLRAITVKSRSRKTRRSTFSQGLTCSAFSRGSSG